MSIIRESLLVGVTVVLLGIGFAEIASADDCAGNACGVVSVSWNGSCYTAKNNDGSKRVYVEFNTGPAKFGKDLGPGESFVPGIPPNCIKSYHTPYSANYK